MRAEQGDRSLRTTGQEVEGLRFEGKNTGIGIVRGEAVLLFAESKKGDALAEAQFRASPLIQLTAVLCNEPLHGRQGVERRIGAGGVDPLNGQIEFQTELLVNLSGIG